MLDGTVVAWGANESGQSSVPVGLSNVIAIAGGGGHSLALRDDGSVVVWGRNNFAQTNVPAGLPLVSGIGAGGSHSLAVLGSDAPQFVRQPLDRLSYVGYAAYLNAAAVSTSPLGYQWIRSGTNVSGATNATLFYPAAQLADSGSYQLLATNILGAITSAPVNLTILPSQPNFITQPTNTAVVPGSNAVFSATVTSPWATTLQWRMNGTNIANATNLSLVISNVQAANEGNYTLMASNFNGLSSSSNAYLDVITLGEALDATNLTWTTSGQVPWKPTGFPFFTAPASASCGPLSNNYHGILQTTVVGPGTLSFRWQNTGSTPFTFFINENTQGSLSFSSWQPRTFYLSNGVFVLKWDAGGVSSLVPAVNVDAVSFVPGTTPAGITSQPVSQSVRAGTNVTLSVGTIGTPPIFYRWSFNGTNLANTGASLTLANIQAPAEGAYSVTVSNAYGSQTSSNFAISILPSAPVFQAQPASQQMLVGGQVSFYAPATGSLPLYYRWQQNGNDLSWATNASITLSNLQLNQNGDYTVVVSNIAGTIVSTNVNLLVFTVPDLAAALDESNISWSTSSNNPWFPQTNITHDGVSAARSGLITNTRVSVLTGTLTGPAAVKFWWKVSCDDFWTSLKVSVNGSNQASITGTIDWQEQTVLVGPGTQTVQWALTNIAFGTPDEAGWLDQVSVTPGWVPVSLMAQPTSASAAAGTTFTFNAAAAGTPPYRYQWQFNGADIANATNATLRLTNLQTNNIGTYSVTVSNDYSLVISSNAALVVNPAGPSMTSQPGDQHMALNGIVTFSATARGSDPLSYQWLFNSNAIPGATNASFVLPSAQPANIGFYRVVVSNSYNLATSSNAYLDLERMVVKDYLTSGSQAATPRGLTNIVAVAAGDSFSVALRADGTVIAWGDNVYGQTNVPVGLSNVVAIAAGASHAVALRADGTVVAWGSSTYGATSVPTNLTGVTAIASATIYTLALKADGTVTGWGTATSGQLNIPTGVSNVVAIAAGYNHGAAVKKDGSVVFWGATLFGQGAVLSWVKGIANVAEGDLRIWVQLDDGTFGIWASSGVQELASAVVVLGGAAVSSFQDYDAVIGYDGAVTSGFPFFLPAPIISDNPHYAVGLSANSKHLLVLANDGTPFMAQRLHDRTATAGTRVTFASGVVGAAPVSYQWQFNNANVPGATNNLLVMTNLPLTAAGSYRCIVSNALGNLTTPVANLEVVRSTPRFASSGAGFNGTNSFEISVTGLSGHGDIVLSTSTNLVDWVPIQTNPPVVGSVVLIDSSAANSVMKFYRIEEK